MPKRRSTLYDLSSLRLRPDGTRIDHPLDHKRPSRAVQDTRGNWIAQDVAGPSRAPAYTKVMTTNKDNEEESAAGEDFAFSEDDVNEFEGMAEDSGEWYRKRKGKRKETGKEKKTRRPQKRRRLSPELSFLDTAESSQHFGSSVAESPRPSESPANGEEKLAALPIPSSDLLKSIHHFAATHYSERGQLFDGSREYRLQRKLKKQGKPTEPDAEEEQQEDDEEIIEIDRSSPAGGDDGDYVDEDSDAQDRVKTRSSSNPKGAAKIESRQKKRKKGKKFYPKDMYKVLEGSALVAIGMLLQGQIARMLTPKPGDPPRLALVQSEEINEEEEEAAAIDDSGRVWDMKAEWSDLENESEVASGGEDEGGSGAEKEEDSEEDGDGGKGEIEDENGEAEESDAGGGNSEDELVMEQDLPSP